VVRVGRNNGNDWRSEKIKQHDNGISFHVRAPEEQFSGEYALPLLGAHQAVNALFSIVVAAKLGMTPEQVRRGLAEAKTPKMRLQMWEFNGVRVLDDTYNANADSMLAALQTLHDLPVEGRRVAVLGDMAELGEHTKAAHAEVGSRAAELGIAHLFTLGPWAAATAEAARSNGMINVSVCPDVETTIVKVKNFVRAGDLLLLKASRVAGLERVSAALRKIE
jgi:UDP-N-acetylmuramoyl-tripeptide--D-alanyl-D-alanine ligase